MSSESSRRIRSAVLSIDDESRWWERFLGTLPKSRRRAFGRVVAINHIRGLITAAVSGLGVLLASRTSVKGELDRGALVPLFPGFRPLEDRFALSFASWRPSPVCHHCPMLD